MNTFNPHALSFLGYYLLSPFRISSDNMLIIPQKYLDVLLDLQPDHVDVDFTSLQATEETWQFIRELLVTGYWMDCWYNNADNLPTPKSKFIPMDKMYKHHIFEEDKFIRLNSLSSKQQLQPLKKLNRDIVHDIISTARCSESMQIAERTGREISIVVRDWVDLSKGTEWRCFIYEDNLKAICLNDHVDPEMKSSTVICRAQLLLRAVKFSMPCVDVLWTSGYTTR